MYNCLIICRHSNVSISTNIATVSCHRRSPLLTSIKLEKNAEVRAETKGRTDGRTRSNLLPPLLWRSVITDCDAQYNPKQKNTYENNELDFCLLHEIMRLNEFRLYAIYLKCCFFRQMLVIRVIVTLCNETIISNLR